MRIKALTTFMSSHHGEIEAGQEFECAADIALIWESAGMVQRVTTYYNTKVVGGMPVVGDIPLTSGLESASSSLPPVQASPKKTSKSSKAKK